MGKLELGLSQALVVFNEIH